MSEGADTDNYIYVKENKQNINNINNNLKDDVSQTIPNIMSNKITELAFLFLFLIFVFISETFYRDPLFNFSVEYLKIFHKDKTDKNFIMISSEILGEIGYVPGYGLIIFLAYNFLNIYKSSMLIFILCNCTLTTGILKMIYMSPRPYFMDKEILAMSLEKGWGNPSGHSLTAVCFFLSFWKILFQDKYLKQKNKLKNVSFIAALILIGLIAYSRFLIGAHSLNQILFGILLGFSIFYFYFFILDIDTERAEQFLSFIDLNNKNKFLFSCSKKIPNYVILIVLNVIFLSLAIFLYYLNIGSEHETHYKNIIFERFNAINVEQPAEWKILQAEGFVNFSFFLANISLFIGLTLEFHFTFKQNIKSWTIYNFEDLDFCDENSQGKINTNQWDYNITFLNQCKKALLIISLVTLIFAPFYFIGKLTQNFFGIILLTIFIPSNLAILGLFYFFKEIFRYFNLINPLPDLDGIYVDDGVSVEYRQII